MFFYLHIQPCEKYDKQRRWGYGVVPTNSWLQNDIDQPSKLCKQAIPELKNSTDFYNYLKNFGMYQSARRAIRTFEKLQEQDAWTIISQYYQHYRKKWNGPSVEIYIFPINEENTYFKQQLKGRSGIALQNKLFLFLSATDDKKYWESLFIHEYHHAARMTKYKKKSENYTLLDSLVFEGLAEQAVLLYCGDKYLSNWQKKFSDSNLQYYWEHYYKPNLKINRKERLHDDLLFGRKKVPKMMGYAIGAELVNGYIIKNKMKITESLHIPSEALLLENSFIESTLIE